MAVSAPIVFVVGFHAAVLLRRVEDASIARPMVLGKWAVAIALLLAALVVRRVPALRGGRRLAIVFWLLVALLHLAAPTGAVEAAFLVVPTILVFAALLGPSMALAQRAAGAIVLDRLVFASPLAHSCRGDRAPPLF